MRRVSLMLLSTTCLTVAYASTSFAADLRVRPTMYRAPVVVADSWTGCYFGGHAGYAVSGASTTLHDDGLTTGDEPLSSDNARGGAYGVQLGCNWQQGQVVYGVEGDYTWTDANSTTTVAEAGGADSAYIKVRNLASVRGRAGLAFQNWLIYVTAGGAWGRSTHTVNDLGLVNTFDRTNSGIVYGAGAEMDWGNGITIRAEYLRYSFGKDEYTLLIGNPESAANLRMDYVDVVRFGLNYKLGCWFGCVR
jgi:outer membrane immunogenic protein